MHIRHLNKRPLLNNTLNTTFKRQTMFLSKEEVARLTGRKTKAKQCAHLKAQHIPFRLNARQEPIVTIASINGVKEIVSSQNWQPSFKVTDSR